VNITLFKTQELLEVSSAFVEEIATSVFKTLEVAPPDELIIHLVDKKTITQLHADFFDDPTPTDCISFPMDEDRSSGYQLLGEIFVCPEVAIEYAEEHQENVYKELCLYIIHGILHLLGYDDIEEADRVVMRQKEALCMKFIETSGIKSGSLV
jgi:probable rRNA maturation factor